MHLARRRPRRVFEFPSECVHRRCTFLELALCVVASACGGRRRHIACSRRIRNACQTLCQDFCNEPAPLPMASLWPCSPSPNRFFKQHSLGFDCCNSCLRTLSRGMCRVNIAVALAFVRFKYAAYFYFRCCCFNIRPRDRARLFHGATVRIQMWIVLMHRNHFGDALC